MSIQAQYECFKEISQANIRTLFTPSDLREITERAGWNIIREDSIVPVGLQDARWEVDITLADYMTELSKLENVPDKLKTYIQSEVKLLREITRNAYEVQTMPTFIFVAE